MISAGSVKGGSRAVLGQALGRIRVDLGLGRLRRVSGQCRVGVG